VPKAKAKPKLRQVAPTIKSVARHGVDQESEWRLPPIPKGFQIFESRIQVAGILHRIEDCLAFVRHPGEHSLKFELEPTNAFDKNAIKIIGTAGAERFHLGYVPAAIAFQLSNKGLQHQVQARLERGFASKDGYVDVIFQIIGPNSAKPSYQN
jgi:hypothetical protein